jgi:hypothetical protein
VPLVIQMPLQSGSLLKTFWRDALPDCAHAVTEVVNAKIKTITSLANDDLRRIRTELK